MSKVPYSKQALSYAEQAKKLKERGLEISNEKKFLQILEKKSYYRLSGYWYPLLADKEKHEFKSGATFEAAYNIYLFDRELRQLVVKELEKIEVAVRAKMIYIFSHQFSPFWYTESTHFKNRVTHGETITKISRENKRSDAQFIKAFQTKYNDSLPPSWTAFEIISFGSISRLFGNFKSGKSKRLVAEYFGLDDHTLKSWLHGIVYVRNVCAHHSRLWNREMRIQPVIPKSPENTLLKNGEIKNNRTYFVISMIIYLLDSIFYKNSIVQDFKNLLAKYPNIDPSAMGFPKTWEEESLWQ